MSTPFAEVPHYRCCETEHCALANTRELQAWFDAVTAALNLLLERHKTPAEKLAELIAAGAGVSHHVASWDVRDDEAADEERDAFTCGCTLCHCSIRTEYGEKCEDCSRGAHQG